jgi:hypothetical protein
VLSGGGRSIIPPALRDLPGDITIVLANSAFVSFTSPPFGESSKRIVGVRGTRFPPMSLPNVPRNVIAHELGHAIGLGHNSDPTTLMCGTSGIVPARSIPVRSAAHGFADRKRKASAADLVCEIIEVAANA